MAFKLEKSQISTRQDHKFLIQRVGINYDTSFDTLSTYVYKSMVKRSVPLQFRSLTTIIFFAMLIGVSIYGRVMRHKQAIGKNKLR